MREVVGGKPLVSVIITCFNQAHYLSDAIRSVLRQTWPAYELIVVDDGSTDHTFWVVRSFARARYLFQENAGLSAARNKGIDECSGDYLVFLDADDLLADDALKKNITVFTDNPSAAFVAGSHTKVNEWLEPLDEQEGRERIASDHYRHLLAGNFIGMHAAVMYARWVFHEFRFDCGLRACEDYDLYLRISRRYPVVSHEEEIAFYRIHDGGMSRNMALMYNTVLRVCRRQFLYLGNNDEYRAYHRGISGWKRYYSEKLLRQAWRRIRKGDGWPSADVWSILLTSQWRRMVSMSLYKVPLFVHRMVEAILPERLRRPLHGLHVRQKHLPPKGHVRPGDFGRLEPFSRDFGFDRGGAVDRFYIERFIQANAKHIRGRVLEIGDNAYTLKYGRALVEKSEILHVDRSNARATYVGDITHVPEIPASCFDCIIFTQTLHLIYDFKSALRTCYRILKPGGCLLLTVPGISNIDAGPWKEHWLWSFTDNAMRRIMRETFTHSSTEVTAYGNVYVAAAFLYGMGLPEIQESAFKVDDPCYQLIVAVRAVKEKEAR